MLKVISALLLTAQVLFPTAPPGVDRSNAYARAAGNDMHLAFIVGTQLFKTTWPAQVLNVYADTVNGTDVVGLRVAGKHFHHKLHRSDVGAEAVDLAAQAFAVSPRIREVDIWITVPLQIGKDIVAADDVNVPTWRTVFTLSAQRSESRAALLARIRRGSPAGVYWDQEWARAVLK